MIFIATNRSNLVDDQKAQAGLTRKTANIS